MNKIFLSADMEGTAGIAHWDETESSHPQYAHFARQMSLEAAAACRGALDGGADEVFIKDGHDSARNIDPELLPRDVRILRGWARHPYSMMAGLDNTFSGAFFTGYHSAASWNTSPLSHTMNRRNNFVTVNGEVCSELMLNCLTASLEGVPVRLVAGDGGICRFIQEKVPSVVTVPVSEGMGNASVSIHPALAVERIEDAAKRAMDLDGAKCLYPMPDSFHVEINFKEHFDATGAQYYPGCRRVDTKTVAFDAREYMDVLKFIYWVL